MKKWFAEERKKKILVVRENTNQFKLLCGNEFWFLAVNFGRQQTNQRDKFNLINNNKKNRINHDQIINKKREICDNIW